MALTGVLRPGHVQIRVLEMEPAMKRYRDILSLIGDHPETGERFRFTISTGHVLELFAEKKAVGNNRGTDGPNLNPNPWPDDLKGIAPSRYDHCLTTATTSTSSARRSSITTGS